MIEGLSGSYGDGKKQTETYEIFRGEGGAKACQGIGGAAA